MTTEDRSDLTEAGTRILDEIETAMAAVNAANGCLREAALKMRGILPDEGAMRNINEQDALIIAHLMGGITAATMTLEALEKSVDFLGLKLDGREGAPSDVPS